MPHYPIKFIKFKEQKLILEKIIIGDLQTNCYMIADKDTQEAAVIDPGGEVASILETAKKHGLDIKYIINTHGHIDHIQGNAPLKEATNAEILIHQKDAGMLTNPLMNGSAIFLGRSVKSPPADKFVEEGDIIEVGALKLEVLYTPGHTNGGISIKLGNRIFVGDTLFHLSIGRTDLPGGSYDRLINSIQEKMLSLPDETLVYPGHGESTSIGAERKRNPYIV
jgi:glyoxylase-like metal-dependent hydrolase (beta-lactamase superfamily II)